MIHRDDLPFEIAEEITKTLQEIHPGHKVIFAGDEPGGAPPELQEIMLQFEVRSLKSATEGICFDCGEKIPIDWPPEEGANIPEGWGLYSDVGNKGSWMLVCPKCEEDTPRL